MGGSKHSSEIGKGENDDVYAYPRDRALSQLLNSCQQTRACVIMLLLSSCAYEYTCRINKCSFVEQILDLLRLAAINDVISKMRNYRYRDDRYKIILLANIGNWQCVRKIAHKQML